MQVLIIDEVSMISAELFQELEFRAREVKHSCLPFGGIQLILSGDFFQCAHFPVAARPTKAPLASCVSPGALFAMQRAMTEGHCNRTAAPFACVANPTALHCRCGACETALHSHPGCCLRIADCRPLPRGEGKA